MKVRQSGFNIEYDDVYSYKWDITVDLSHKPSESSGEFYHGNKL
jgi:hypothetical protein